MKSAKLYVLMLSVALCYCELLGPEAKHEESDDENEEESSEHNDKYISDIHKAVSEQIEELKDYMSKTKDEDIRRTQNAELRRIYKQWFGSQDSTKKDDENVLDEIKGMTDKLVGQMNPDFFDAVIELQRNNLEVLENNPEDILGKLPPVQQEEEQELTPELHEAKSQYDEALLKLSRRSPDVYSAIMAVKEAAGLGYIPARIKLAWSYVYGEGVEMDIEKAKEIFVELSEQGIADAHAGMGFMYATGIGVPVSQAKALVHYMIGAIDGSTYAQMAMAYRFWSGVTVTGSCSKALDFYMKVAGKVAASVTLSGGPALQRIRLLDEAEGTGSGTLDGDLIEYYQLLAEKGDVQAQIGLGQLHFQGGRGVTLDIKKALHYFQQAAKAGNAVANAFLGKIYLEGGDGIKADNETALKYFRKATELNNPVGQSGLGVMYLQGRSVPKDTSAAFKYFTMAANQGWVEGQLHLGFMYFSGIGVRRDFKQANKYFSLASQSGHVLAFYHLAHMHAQGLGTLRSCSTAVELFKNVCERGKWGDRLMRGHMAWKNGDSDSAFLMYASLAEMGYELAQSNAAYLLDSGEVTLFNDTERWIRALQLWGRAASQGNSAARVKLGDYHYYGLGTKQDYEAAAHHYRIASEQQHNAQATFNLGYMHSRGLGLARDPHLAKRCYDQAAETSPDARLPAALALAALHATSALSSLNDSPLALIFLTGDSPLLVNWDIYVIATLVGTLGLVLYFRRPIAPEAQ